MKRMYLTILVIVIFGYVSTAQAKIPLRDSSRLRVKKDTTSVAFPAKVVPDEALVCNGKKTGKGSGIHCDGKI